MVTIPPGKTPISYLQELCTKRGLTPVYVISTNEGAVHEPSFTATVTVGDISASGQGTSKKKTKHAAAQMILGQILATVTPNGLNAATGDASSNDNNINPTEPVADNEVRSNPIGVLQELTQKNLMRPPLYEFTNEQGPPHAKEYICTVRLGKIQEKGSARSKKLAKRIAAQNMLNYIFDQSAADDNNIEKEEDNTISTVESLTTAYTSLKDGKVKVSVLSPTQNKEIQKFYQSIIKKSSKQLKNLQGKPLNSPATNYCQILQEISEAQKFDVRYNDILEQSDSGLYQCLFYLSTMPVAVCYGTGPTVEDTHANVAHHALQYLKLMTKS